MPANIKNAAGQATCLPTLKNSTGQATHHRKMAGRGHQPAQVARPPACYHTYHISKRREKTTCLPATHYLTKQGSACHHEYCNRLATHLRHSIRQLSDCARQSDTVSDKVSDKMPDTAHTSLLKKTNHPLMGGSLRVICCMPSYVDGHTRTPDCHTTDNIIYLIHRVYPLSCPMPIE